MPEPPSVLTRIASRAAAHLNDADEFVDRLAAHGERALMHLEALYGERDDFAATAGDIFDVAISAVAQRPQPLCARDRRRESDRRWYLRRDLIGAWCYVDRFSGTLLGLLDHLDYLDELSVTYLHLMPPFARPDGPNDGGYAVSDYRRVHPQFGSMDDLRSVAAALHDRGISLALDFVFNHTADDHPWALAAKAGSRSDLECYLTFATEAEVEEYQPWLRSIFPDEKPGSFIWEPTLARWVWSTFHDYQWDLDYRNPDVFRRMLGEMLHLANAGVDILRLDAVPFVWKEAGTSCEGLPQAHTIIRAFNALVRIAAPAMIFKSEAIVHPDEVRSYLGTAGANGRESELAYHPLLMVELWEALATGHTHLLRRSMLDRFEIPPATGWVNYVRSHDDIGWGFADEDADRLEIDPGPHRNYLNDFYAGKTPGAWSRGVPFQVNPATGDARMSGTTASLAGLEQAMLHNDRVAIDLAVRRIILLYGIAIATPGSPLLNLGDELGTLNDLSYLRDPELAADNRWLHRPAFDWERSHRRHSEHTIEGRLHGAISTMLRLRTKVTEFDAGTPYRPRDVGNDHVYVVDVGATIVIAGNFTGASQVFDAGTVPLRDLLTGATAIGPTELEPYGLRWFATSR